MAVIPKMMRRGVAETFGTYTANLNPDPQQWRIPSDAAADRCFCWQVVPAGTAFATVTVTINASIDGINFSLWDTSTNVAGEIRFPAGRPVAVQIVIAVTGGDGTSKLTVLGKVA